MKIDERNPITLRFNNKEQEFAYQYSNYPAKIQQIRVVFLLFIMLYSAFGLLDRHMAQEYTNIFLMIRFAVVIPIFVIILLSSFTKMFLKMHNFALLIAFIISGLGIAAMLVMVPTNLSYYGGLFMILYSGFFLIRLGFFHASIGAWVVFIGYVAGSFAINGVSGLDFLAMLFFYFFSIVIGMFGSYYIELFSRRDFIQKEMIAADKREMERRVSKRFQEISRAQEATLLALAKLAESRDIYTVDHVERVGSYSRILAEHLDARAEPEMKMSKHRFFDLIASASYLHDIGKIGIPDHILNKPGKLNSEEFEIIKKHVAIGSENLIEAQAKNPDNHYVKMGLEIVQSHHEHYDGSGYPNGLSGKEIPLAARIVAVADSYDALRSKRPYKNPISHEKTLQTILLASGTQYDPMVVSALIRAEDALNAYLINSKS